MNQIVKDALTQPEKANAIFLGLLMMRNFNSVMKPVTTTLAVESPKDQELSMGQSSVASSSRVPTNCANCGAQLNSPRCESCGYWNPGN